jgi:hypothetical protein
LEGDWRASKNGGWEGEFEGVCKIEVCLEVLLELGFCTKPSNFGVEAHMEASTGVALTSTILARAVPSYVMQPRINSRRNFPKVLCSCDGLFYLIVLKPTTSQLCEITAVGDINYV